MKGEVAAESHTGGAASGVWEGKSQLTPVIWGEGAGGGLHTVPTQHPTMHVAADLHGVGASHVSALHWVERFPTYAGCFHHEPVWKSEKEQRPLTDKDLYTRNATTTLLCNRQVLYQLIHCSHLPALCNRSSKACTACPETIPNHCFAIIFEFSVNF